MQGTLSSIYLFPGTSVCPPENSMILIYFLPVLVSKNVPTILMWHCSSAMLLRGLKSIITAAVRQTAPGLISSAPTQCSLSMFYADSLETASSFQALQPVFGVEQLMRSLMSCTGPSVPAQREQLRHFNLCAHLEPDERSATLETMRN